MQKNIFKLLAVVFLVIFCISPTVFADDGEQGDEKAPFYLGDPVVAGMGCPEGSYQVVLTPDGKMTSVLFNSLTAMTDELENYAFSNCNIAVPIEVPAGITIGLTGADYRGLAYIPTDGLGVLYREYYFSGAQGPQVVSSIDVFDQYHEFFYGNDFDVVLWTECGDDVIAHFDVTVFAFRPSDGDTEAFMSVFSEGWNPSLELQLMWQYCTEDDDSAYSLELK